MTIPNQQWTSKARCIGVDPSVFFPEEASGHDWHAEAKSICARCRVRSECLEAAIERGEVGVWGGTDEEERRRIRRDRGLLGTYHRELQPCGTEAAYQRHRRNAEVACEECLRAHRLHIAVRRETVNA